MLSLNETRSGASSLSHLLALLFGFILSFGHHNAAAAHADPFIPPAEMTASFNDDIPVTNHRQTVRRASYNSYSEDACLSCPSTIATSQPRLLTRAQR
jgi:hypothetical protein